MPRSWDRRLVRLYKKLLPNWIEYMLAELNGARTILDLGCGNDSIVQRLPQVYTVGVDIYLPYLEESRAKRIHDDYLLADITTLALPPKSFDVVLASEVLEHLDKGDGLRLLANMELWARHKVVIKVPNGHVEQNEFDDNPHQRHKSAWTLEELETLGYSVKGVSGWRRLRGARGMVRLRPYFLGDRIADLTQPLVYNRPKCAFQLLGVKAFAK